MPRLPQAFSVPSQETQLHNQKRSQLDRLYQRVVDDLDNLVGALGLNAA
jgi:hypothetical protein